MEDTLSDESKFTKIGCVEKHDRTAKIEKKFQDYLLDLKKKELLPEAIINVIRPVGSRRSRMYGLPKVHKEGNPLRPIVSTIRSVQRPVADYLKDVLQPVYEKYATYTVQDTESFVNDIKSLNVDRQNCFMCSFDIKSLFTNILLKEVIDICAPHVP